MISIKNQIATPKVKLECLTRIPYPHPCHVMSCQHGYIGEVGFVQLGAKLKQTNFWFDLANQT